MKQGAHPQVLEETLLSGRADLNLELMLYSRLVIKIKLQLFRADHADRRSWRSGGLASQGRVPSGVDSLPELFHRWDLVVTVSGWE